MDWLGDREVFFCNQKGADMDVFDTSAEQMIKCCNILSIDNKKDILYIRLNEECKHYMHDPMGHLSDPYETDPTKVISICIRGDIEVIEIINTIEESSLKGLNLKDLLN